MKKISQILKESTIKQVTGDLARFDYENNLLLIGKCALGVLACESGKDSLKLTPSHNWVDYTMILNAYGIKNEFYPKLHLSISGVIPKEIWDFKEELDLSSIIIRLNDTYNFTFKEIGEFLEVTFDL